MEYTFSDKQFESSQHQTLIINSLSWIISHHQTHVVNVGSGDVPNIKGFFN